MAKPLVGTDTSPLISLIVNLRELRPKVRDLCSTGNRYGEIILVKRHCTAWGFINNRFSSHASRFLCAKA
jgi:hypothetical protein